MPRFFKAGMRDFSKKILERWPSGLRRTPGERVAIERLLESSNLSLSVLLRPRRIKDYGRASKQLRSFEAKKNVAA